MEENVFSDETELRRLKVQGRLLREYEQPVCQQVLGNRKGLTLLDVGCNDGRKTTDRFSEEHFSKVVGIDCLELLIEQAKVKYGNDAYVFHACNVATPDFSEKIKLIMQAEKIVAFDVIYCSFLLMHLKHPLEVLGKLKSLLAPEGCLIVIEPDDTESFLKPDPEGLFSQFLKVLAADPYAGKRNSGKELAELLQESGYSDIKLQCSEIGATGSEISKKEDIFTTFCSYLPEDLVILKKREPEHPVYVAGWEWVEKNFEKLHRQMVSEESWVSMGVKIYTCGGIK